MAVDYAPRETVSESPRICAILLVRNEDLHVATVLTNILCFCDEILVADHGSTDRTSEILRELERRHPAKVRLSNIDHPAQSHKLISQYAGTPTWIFGVDGDEIYDPAGLRRLRNRLLTGEFARSWMLLGNVLNCVSLNVHSGEASGHLAPPCRSITKLYNFHAIERWDGDCKERLHGGRIEFRSGFNSEQRRYLHDEVTWESADLRCLHLCFLPRSSNDAPDAAPRANIMEIHATGLRARLVRWLRRSLFKTDGISKWKRSRYMRGPLVTVDASPFFSILPE